MWYRVVQIIDWFGDMADRYRLIKDFNKSAKDAYISGLALTLLNAKISKGDSNYSHAFSKWFAGGFRIKALSGRPLKRIEMIEIGRIILDQEVLVRKLISLGWDTLEVHDDTGYNGCKWELQKHTGLGGFLD